MTGMREIDETTADAPGEVEHSGDEQVSAELSRAAREAVRQSDPRIDRQLAKMGLAQADDAAADPAAPGRPIRASDLDPLREELGAARSEAASLAATVEQLRGRVTLFGWLVGVEGVALVVVAVLLLLR